MYLLSMRLRSPSGRLSPKKELSLVLAGFVALMLGVGVAFYKEGADEGLKTAEGIRQYLDCLIWRRCHTFRARSKRELMRSRCCSWRKWTDDGGGQVRECIETDRPQGLRSVLPRIR